MTHIITRFTLIVSRASKPLRGRLNHHVTMMGNQVMMTVIHTNVRRDPLQRVRDNGVPTGRLRGRAMRHAIVAPSTRRNVVFLGQLQFGAITNIIPPGSL